MQSRNHGSRRKKIDKRNCKVLGPQAAKSCNLKSRKAPKQTHLQSLSRCSRPTTESARHRECDCAGYVPDNGRPAPVNSTIGRVLRKKSSQPCPSWRHPAAVSTERGGPDAGSAVKGHQFITR